MKAEYLQRGEALDYKNRTDATIHANSVVAIGDRIGVIGTDIPPGAIGSIHVVGVFSMDKAEGKDVAIGTALYFDEEAGNLTTDAEGNIPAGYAAADSESAATTVLVSIGHPVAGGGATSSGGSSVDTPDHILIKGTGSDSEKVYKITVAEGGGSLTITENT